jgi:hypothetical protein
MSATEHDGPMELAIEQILASLLERWLQPRREGLEAVRAVLSQEHEPARAWQLLCDAKLIPAELLASPARRFGMLDTSRRRPQARAAGEPRHDHPPTLAAVETFAAGAAGMLEAERLGRELAQRLVAWGGPEISAVEWFCLSHERPMPFDLGHAYDSAYNSLEYALSEEGHELGALRPDDPRLPHLANNAIRAHLGWQTAAEMELEVPAAYWPPSTAKWKSFTELQNPFEAALALFQTGYLPDAIRPDDPVLRFFTFGIGAPPVSRPGQA